MKSGMSITDEKGLNSEEICNIIEACSEAKVRELKFRGLHLAFGPTVEASGKMASSHNRSAKEIAETQQEEHERALDQEMLDEKDDELELMKIENPVEYERLIVDGALERATEGREEA